MNIIDVSNLQKSFKVGFWMHKTPILHGLSFHVEPGQITGFLGKNGAGKTTTIKCLLGLVRPDSGTIKYFGEEGLTAAVKARIGFLPERPYFYDYLTGEEFLQFYGELSGRITRADLGKRISSLLELVGLAHAQKKSLRSYSKGMLQRIGIAQALIHRPEFVIFDEPMSGLDPDGRAMVTKIIQDTAAQGTTVFFSSHLLHDAEQICQNLLILNEGRVAYAGDMESLLGKMERGVRISYIKDGKIVEDVMPAGAAVNEKMDWVLKNKFEIREVKRERPSLEEAFLEVSKATLTSSEAAI